MGREEKRKFFKIAKRKGLSRRAAEDFLNIKSGFDRLSHVEQFQEDDKVMLDVDAIMKHPDWDKLNSNYKAFVEGNRNTVFTAHIEKERLISLKENPDWLFWSGSLLKMSGE